MVTMPASANSSLRSFERTWAVAMPSESSKSRVAVKRAPRGTAIVSVGVIASLVARRSSLGLRTPRPATCHLPPATSFRSFLRRLRHVHALHVQRNPTRRQLAAELPDQLVVAPAPAQGEAHGGVVELEDGTRVVTEFAHQAEVEDHAVGNTPLLEQRVQGTEVADPARHRAVGPLEDLGSAAELRKPHEQVRQVELPDAHLEPGQVPSRQRLEELEV